MKSNSKKLRVILSSDMHYSIASQTPRTVQSDYYGITNDERLQHWVDCIKAEHARTPIDLLLIAGDVSFDLCDKRGTITNGLGSTIEPFMEKYVSQLPSDIPMFIMPGNHDPHYDENWVKKTGFHRQGYVLLEDNLFIMLDTFPEGLEEHYDIVKGTPYVRVNVDYVKEVMAKYPAHKVWLVSHYFHHNAESEEFQALVRENDRIMGLFAGHSHQSLVIQLDERYGNKTIAQTGHFSYSFYMPFPTGNVEDEFDAFFGFRELVIGEDHAYSNYIVPDTKGLPLVLKDKVTKVDLRRREVHPVEYQIKK
ncbi:MAG: metallophosphoesterase [Clostridia bacterium]|nr:metallophosphoesterase [Clostridia bacterium]